MMRLISLRTGNFRLLRQADLSFKNGLYFIGGENADVAAASSNMAGKSTLLHAITYCLYGVDAVGMPITADAVTEGQSDCYVELNFEDFETGRQLTVIRNRYNKSIPTGTSRNILWIIWDGKASTSTGGAAEQHQAEIDALFGPMSLFLAAHVFGYDESATPFALSGDREQKRLFDLLIGAADLDSAWDRAAVRIKQLRVDIQEHEQEAYALQAQIAVHQENLVAASAKQGDVTDIEDRLAAAERGRQKCCKDRSILEAKYQVRASVVQRITQEIADVQQQTETATLVLRQEQGNLPGLVSASRELRTTLEGLMLTSGGEQTTCPICDSPLTLEQLGTLRDTCLAETGRLEKRLVVVGLLISQAFAKNGNDARQRALQEEKADKQACEALISDSSLQEARASAESKALQEQLDAARRDLSSAVTGIQTALAETTTKAQVEVQAQTQAQMDLDVMLFWQIAFGPKGIKAYRLDQVTPLLNAIAVRYSYELFGPGTVLRYDTQSRTKKGDLRERFEVALYEEKEGVLRKVKTALSAGQAMRRDIIHMFSMVELVEHLGKRTVDFLALDEVFRTLDGAGIDAVMRVLRHLNKTIRTLWVIEHNDDLQAQFDQSITVVRKNGVATPVGFWQAGTES